MDVIYNILSKDMNIDKLRAEYIVPYNYVKKLFLDHLKKDANFKDIFSDEKLCGSYADNLKIIKPNEFDLVLRFKLPEVDMVEILRDETKKGNVLINLTRVLEKIDGNYKIRLHRFLASLVNSDGFLLVNAFQKWLEGLMTQFMNKIGHKITIKDNEYNLLYKREGPAHTIYVICGTNAGNCLLSIDFVPGFVFSGDVAKTQRPLSEGLWEAIPRPLKGAAEAAKDYCSFRTSYTNFERLIISNKCKLKSAIRIMKKYRDLKPELYMLKSYYIKTQFLWMCEEYPEALWKVSIRDIMIKVFEVFEHALSKKEIKFYWDSDLNLLEHLPDVTVAEMHRIVAESRRTLVAPVKHDRDVYLLFLSEEELEVLSPEKQRLIADSFAIPQVSEEELKDASPEKQKLIADSFAME